MMTPSQIEAKMSAIRSSRLSTVPESAKTLFRKVFTGQATRNQCIKAQCLECMGFDRAEIGVCTAYACSLWKYRPFQKKGGA